MNIYRKGKSDKSSFHTDLWMRRNFGDSHHIKTSFRLVMIIPIFLAAYLVSNQPLTEMSTRNLPEGKGRPANKAEILVALCELTV
jgi:hypothetical protein